MNTPIPILAFGIMVAVLGILITDGAPLDEAFSGVDFTGYNFTLDFSGVGGLDAAGDVLAIIGSFLTNIFSLFGEIFEAIGAFFLLAFTLTTLGFTLPDGSTIPWWIRVPYSIVVGGSFVWFLADLGARLLSAIGSLLPFTMVMVAPVDDGEEDE